MSGPEVAVGAVALHDGCLLLVRRGHGPAAGSWSLPGGRVEAGETLHETVVREVAEETGFEVAVAGFLGWVETLPTQQQPSPHFVILDFAVDVLHAEVAPRPGDDATEAVWAPLGTLAERRLVPGLWEFLVEVGVTSD